MDKLQPMGKEARIWSSLSHIPTSWTPPPQAMDATGQMSFLALSLCSFWYGLRRVMIALTLPKELGLEYLHRIGEILPQRFYKLGIECSVIAH